MSSSPLDRTVRLAIFLWLSQNAVDGFAPPVATTTRVKRMIAKNRNGLTASSQVTAATATTSHLTQLHAATTTTTTTTTALPQGGGNSGSEPMPWPRNTQAYGRFQPEPDWALWFSCCTPEAEGTYTITADADDESSHDVEGIVPDCLAGGTYYRNGPAKFERRGCRYEHFLDGDGFVVAIGFGAASLDNNDKNGTVVRYTGRFVETEYYRREQEADTILYRNAFGTEQHYDDSNDDDKASNSRRNNSKSNCPFRNALDGVELKNVANTNVLAWGGRLLALWEAGAPYELDPVTLETLGSSTGTSSSATDSASSSTSLLLAPPLAQLLGGADCRTRGVTVDDGGALDNFLKVGKSFTAHPVILPHEQRLVAFGSATRAGTITAEKTTTLLDFYEFDADWNTLHTTKYHVTEGLAPHDFAVSADHYCFFQNRCTLDLSLYLLESKPLSHALRLFLRKPSILHLVPRGTSGSRSGSSSKRNQPNAKPIQVSIPHYFNIHTVAEARQVDHSNNKLLILYNTGWDLTQEQFFPPEEQTVSLFGSFGGLYPNFVDGGLPPPSLYRTVVNLETHEVVSHQTVIDGLVMELPVADDANPHRFIYGVAYSDTADYLPPTGLCKVDTERDTVDYWWSEHRTFVGEAISVAKRNGDPGSWVLSVVSDAARKRSSLVILDSERFSQGPVARIHLKHHLPYGLHSSFSF